MLINESSILLPKNYYSLLWYFFPVYAECVSLLRNWFSTHYYESIAKNSRLGAVCVRFGAACQVKWSVLYIHKLQIHNYKLCPFISQSMPATTSKLSVCFCLQVGFVICQKQKSKNKSRPPRNAAFKRILHVLLCIFFESKNYATLC